MIPDINARLTVDEYQSRLDVSKGAMQSGIPVAHKARLLQVGYIKEGLGGLILTDAGQMRIAIGR